MANSQSAGRHTDHSHTAGMQTVFPRWVSHLFGGLKEVGELEDGRAVVIDTELRLLYTLQVLLYCSDLRVKLCQHLFGSEAF